MVGVVVAAVAMTATPVAVHGTDWCRARGRKDKVEKEGKSRKHECVHAKFAKHNQTLALLGFRARTAKARTLEASSPSSYLRTWGPNFTGPLCRETLVRSEQTTVGDFYHCLLSRRTRSSFFGSCSPAAAVSRRPIQLSAITQGLPFSLCSHVVGDYQALVPQGLRFVQNLRSISGDFVCYRGNRRLRQ